MENDDWEDINLTVQGNICASSNNLVALIDADTIIVGACSTHSYYEELLHRDMYSDEEWDNIINEVGYDSKSNCINFINLQEAFDHSMDKISMIMQETGCSDFELHFTGGRNSFRYTVVSDTYKANRMDGNPIYGIWMLKQLFMERLPDKTFLNELWEADDLVVSLKRDNPDKYILCAVDKDVLYSLEGSHFNYYSSVKYNIQMKFVDVDSITAMKHHYHQTLTGDPGDNVIGLVGVGKKTADKLLSSCTTESECWKVVVDTYISKGRDELDAITNMRLVSMHQLKLVDNKYEVQLWKPM